MYEYLFELECCVFVLQALKCILKLLMLFTNFKSESMFKIYFTDHTDM